MEVTNVLFTNLLTELGHLSRIDGMASIVDGIDGNGRTFTVLPEELAVYISNTQKVLNSTKDSSGEIVGLPIDLEDHTWNGGAGWIVGLELDEARKVIIFLVNWTEKGVEEIAGNITRFFSPAFDTEKKLIMGGALLNQPGSRDQKNGKYLLRPVELSKSMSTITKEKDMTVEAVPEVKPDLLAELRALPAAIIAALNPRPGKQPEPKAETVAELMQNPEVAHELARRADAIAADRNALYERQQHVVKLAADMVGGTPARPFVLAGITSAEIVELLMGLPMSQSQAVERVICKLMDANAIINTQELGVGGGYARKPRVPAEYRAALQEWVNSGQVLSAWFTKVMPEVGKAEDFNLTEFVKEA